MYVLDQPADLKGPANGLKRRRRPVGFGAANKSWIGFALVPAKHVVAIVARLGRARFAQEVSSRAALEVFVARTRADAAHIRWIGTGGTGAFQIVFACGRVPGIRAGSPLTRLFGGVIGDATQC